MVIGDLWVPENLDRIGSPSSLARNLGQLYERIPRTTCRKCGLCCGDSPPMHFLEYANVYQCLRRKAKLQYVSIVGRCLEYYFFSPVEPSLACVFLSDQQCLIYAQRPRVCRIYGLYESVEDLAERSRQLSEQLALRQRILDDAYAAYGITVAHRRPLPLCQDVLNERGNKIRVGLGEKAAWRRELQRMEARLVHPSASATEQTLLPFPTHIAYSLFGVAEARSLQISILQAYQKDSSAARLQARALLA